ncbi:hypothetical protein ABZ128_26140 [Streptomyces sp. NPDC006326]|uniref:hypothetical protein n=1 Tax=Streptomyces sp. NPDC006326 TaxID=3156752 RepID=UPI0033A641C5
MSAAAGVPRDPRPSTVPMGALLAAGAAATAVSTPPARDRVPQRPRESAGEGVSEQAAPESEAA